jgi:hypothetical protein
MFDLRFKSMQFVTTYLGHENVVVVVKYDEHLLFPLLTKIAELLMFVSVEEIEDLQSQIHVKDLFHTITTNANTCMDLVSKEFVGFRSYLVDAKNCKCVLF